ncbi:MAG TPA: cytochrome c [Verrucomicrobiae bacterium]|jgi:mono/diheme cytochrome c family protein|nr:cytochrome c [Verrucomicrobiae bacterium]
MKPDRKKGQTKARELHPPARSKSADPEPSAGHFGLPVSLFVILAILLFWAMVYLDNHAGGFNPHVYQHFTSSNELTGWIPFDPVRDRYYKGKQVYDMPTCLACHGPTGAGAPNQYPPLGGSEWVQQKDPSRMIRIALDGAGGPLPVNGVTYNGSMTPWRPTLSDEQIALVLSYVRQSFGNNQPPVTTEEVAAIRKATAAHAGTPWTADELLKVPLKE